MNSLKSKRLLDILFTKPYMHPDTNKLLVAAIENIIDGTDFELNNIVLSYFCKDFMDKEEVDKMKKEINLFLICPQPGYTDLPSIYQQILRYIVENNYELSEILSATLQFIS